MQAGTTSLRSSMSQNGRLPREQRRSSRRRIGMMRAGTTRIRMTPSRRSSRKSSSAWPRSRLSQSSTFG